ncbi:hypothetical protein Tco_1225741 [Tanacetum coccineum]
MKEIGKSSRIDDEFIQDQRQRDDNYLQGERQDQPKEEEVEPRRSKRARTEKSFGPYFVSFMVENKPTSYREAMKSTIERRVVYDSKWKQEAPVPKSSCRTMLMFRTIMNMTMRI